MNVKKTGAAKEAARKDETQRARAIRFGIPNAL